MNIKIEKDYKVFTAKLAVIAKKKCIVFFQQIYLLCMGGFKGTKQINQLFFWSFKYLKWTGKIMTVSSGLFGMAAIVNAVANGKNA